MEKIILMCIRPYSLPTDLKNSLKERVLLRSFPKLRKGGCRGERRALKEEWLQKFSHRGDPGDGSRGGSGNTGGSGGGGGNFCGTSGGGGGNTGGSGNGIS
jgi:hypothetical protein